jgi:hypothetical protein
MNDYDFLFYVVGKGICLIGALIFFLFLLWISLQLISCCINKIFEFTRRSGRNAYYFVAFGKFIRIAEIRKSKRKAMS